MSLSRVINDAVSFIHLADQSRKTLAIQMEPLRPRLLEINGEVLEERIIFPVTEKSVTARVVGVDSGFVSKRLSNLDILLVRAMAAVFDLENGVVKKCHYLPGIYSGGRIRRI